MRLCLVSDTHRHRHELLTAVKSAQPLDAILHAGDETSDVQWLAERVDWPILAVSGNWDQPTPAFPLERVIADFGPVIYLTHGHHLRVKEGLAGLVARAQACAAQVAVFGHTHMAMASVQNGCLLVNPGSLSIPRGRRERTFALLEVEPATSGQGFDVRVSHWTAAGDLTNTTLRLHLPAPSQPPTGMP
ncbi:metallophosphoesterase family protein [Alicyclobacillus sp.]|uniref:metallophosphoesterase family protein n=1 Tax=Alicyclobacillus sp. TaxID=61169 RepID=UPI0025C552FB|nr:metallophosphoesterase family protein [Alicyclobacillus sp.]MCL6516587.1 YfcE family phosphodiesterase [Alicyclobacillus sp.]